MGAGTVLSIAKGAKEAQRELARAGGAKREAALREISSALRENVQSILEANRADIAAARENGMAESMIDRLTLTAERIEGMAKGVDDVAAMPDPVGRVLSGSTRPNGLRIEKVTVPLGVIGIIYEARPNVTSDAAALCLKAGNAVILRGGKEAINSNKAVANLMRAAVEKAGLPADTVNLIEDTSRESANELMKMNGLVDVLIPRGGAGLQPPARIARRKDRARPRAREGRAPSAAGDDRRRRRADAPHGLLTARARKWAETLVATASEGRIARRRIA